jgi:hypothetical protein
MPNGAKPGYLWIAKGAVERRQLEIDVIDFDGAGTKVGGKQEVAVDVGAECKLLIDRAVSAAIGIVDNDDGIGRVDRRIPSGNGAVLGIPDEDGLRAAATAFAADRQRFSRYAAASMCLSISGICSARCNSA